MMVDDTVWHTHTPLPPFSLQNHLDLHSVLWLQSFLCTELADCAMVIVSHDRAFLNATTTDIMHFTQKTITYYPGDFDTFLTAREDHIAKMQTIQDGIDRKVKHAETQIIKLQSKMAKNDSKKLVHCPHACHM